MENGLGDVCGFAAYITQTSQGYPDYPVCLAAVAQNLSDLIDCFLRITPEEEAWYTLSQRRVEIEGSPTVCEVWVGWRQRLHRTPDFQHLQCGFAG